MAGILRSTSMLSVVGSVTPVMVGDLRAAGCRLRFAGMRDRETIDSELRLLVAVRRTARELTGRTRAYADPETALAVSITGLMAIGDQLIRRVPRDPMR